MKKKMLVLMGLAALLTQTSCKSEHDEKEEMGKLLVTSPVMKDTLVTKEYVCQVKAIRHIEIRAQQRGYLQDIFIDEGQFVKQGQRLFQIMPRIYNAEFQRAQAEADFARIEYQNTKMLADSNIVSDKELALVKAKYDKAKAEMALAQVHLDFTDITAPFNGIIDRFYLKLGSLVDEGDLLTTLSDNSEMWVYFNVSEAEYLDYKSNLKENDSVMKVRLLMANNREFNYPGLVKTIEADFNNETGNIAFRATFPNPKGLLRHGETGTILMDVPFKNALIIPQKATFEILEKKYVFVVDKSGKVKQVEIEVIGEMPDLYVVKSGVTTKDKILLEGIRKVTNGEKIEYRYEDPNKVLEGLKVYVE